MTMNTHRTTKQVQKTNNYDDTVKLLTSQGKFYINLGLERITQVLDLMGNPQNNFKCIQVAGTNGKGSVCSILNSILIENGYKTGLYLSPHIFRYMERIKINNEDIQESDFCNYLNEVIEISESNKIHLTEFEILTAIMFKYFSDKNIDIAIIETGLGGRLDATNVVSNNICSVITHIDLDHTDRLGSTKEQIAYEKSGIIKENSLVITNENYEVINSTATSKNSKIVKGDTNYADNFMPYLNLKGKNQKENLSLVLSIIKELFPDISDETIKNGLNKVKHPFRFQFIEDKNLIIDGAHNPNCFESLRENLDYYYPDIPKQYIFGCLNTKDYESMLKYITTDKTLKKLYFYQFNNINSCDFDTLQSNCDIKAAELHNKTEIKYTNDTLTVICGSFYMLSELIDEKYL